MVQNLGLLKLTWCRSMYMFALVTTIVMTTSHRDRIDPTKLQSLLWGMFSHSSSKAYSSCATFSGRVTVWHDGQLVTQMLNKRGPEAEMGVAAFSHAVPSSTWWGAPCRVLRCLVAGWYCGALDSQGAAATGQVGPIVIKNNTFQAEIGYITFAHYYTMQFGPWNLYNIVAYA